MPTAREFAGGKLSFHRLYISRQWEARNRKIIGVPPLFPDVCASSRSDSVSRDILSLPLSRSSRTFSLLQEKYLGTLETPRKAREREREFAELPEVTREDERASSEFRAP